jgi:hypothetical protein
MCSTLEGLFMMPTFAFRTFRLYLPIIILLAELPAQECRMAAPNSTPKEVTSEYAEPNHTVGEPLGLLSKQAPLLVNFEYDVRLHRMYSNTFCSARPERNCQIETPVSISTRQNNDDQPPSSSHPAFLITNSNENAQAPLVNSDTTNCGLLNYGNNVECIGAHLSHITLRDIELQIANQKADIVDFDYDYRAQIAYPN